SSCHAEMAARAGALPFTHCRPERNQIKNLWRPIDHPSDGRSTPSLDTLEARVGTSLTNIF
ncbi:MAG: hypothetical protein ACKVON_06200, partial [Beijerinckiaceae bacterium]